MLELLLDIRGGIMLYSEGFCTMFYLKDGIIKRGIVIDYVVVMRGEVT